MNDITYEEYVNAIRNKYVLQNGGDLSTLLARPTRANLKKACIEAFEKRKQQNDKKILKKFFDIQDEDGFNIKRNFEKDKFVPIINFLKGKTDSIHSSLSLELVAVLIDFEPRPFLEFKKNATKVTNPPGSNKPKEPVIPEPPVYKWKEITIIIIIIFTFLAIIYFGVDWQQKDCMVWKEDRYIKAVCPEKYNPKYISLDKKVVKDFRKIKVDSNTVFFTKGEPLVWYKKVRGEIECFNQKDVHPIYRDSLKPITQTIVRNYILKE